MTPAQSPYTDLLKRKFHQGKPIIGTFLKIPGGHVTEMLGAAGYDFVIIDQEHAPFDRLSVDHALAAALAWRIDALVRVPSSEPEHILSALDGGATGILIPHVQNAAQAKAAVDAAKYSRERGFALATRAAGWGQLNAAQHIEESDLRTLVIAQIEDLAGLDNVEQIAAEEGIDGLFIGRGDLSVALKAASPNDPSVFEACKHIAAAAKRHGKSLSAFVATEEEARALWKVGVTVFMYSTDQAILVNAAKQAALAIRQLSEEN